MKLTDLVEGYSDSNSLMRRFAEQWAPDFPPPGPICMFGETAMVAYEYGWGRMFSGGDVRPKSGEDWGFDNGAWTAYLRGEGFPTSEFLERLEQAREAVEKTGNPPTVAVAPDIVKGGRESLDFSLRWMEDERLPGTWPWYLALQGGMTVEDVEEVLPEFDGLFLGGDNELKQQGRIWADLARAYNMPFHYGQCGTPGKLTHAFSLGATSLDSVSPVKTRKSLFKFLSHYGALSRQHPDYQGTVRE